MPRLSVGHYRYTFKYHSLVYAFDWECNIALKDMVWRYILHDFVSYEKPLLEKY